MAISDYLEDELLDHSLGVAAFSSPATVYLALFTSDPTDAGSGTEVSGGSYARQSVAFNPAASGATANSADVEFTGMPAATVTHWGLFDASSAGNLLWHGAFTTSKTYSSGDVARVNAGDLDVTLD